MPKLSSATLKRVLAVAASVLPLIGSSGSVSSAVESTPVVEAPSPLRISPGLYKQSIIDIFGPSIDVEGRFEPEEREEGLMAVGARKVSVTDAGLELYDDIARGIAVQVLDEKRRASLVPCTPQSATAADDACARAFITQTGRLIYRRPLSEQEIAAKVKLAGNAAATLKDFYAGLGAILADMLISPDFLFRHRTIEPDPAAPGEYRLDGYAKAAQLAAFLWNSAPDDMLLTAAAKGELHTPDGLRRQVDRMASSPTIESGVRAFFADMLGFADFETLAKDPMFFPAYTIKAKGQTQEQTLRTIVDHLVTNQGDYRDLFTTPRTFLTRSLAALYNVPLVELADNGQPDRWIPFSYPEGDPRAGILSQASFVALHSPSGRSSPTLRGKALRENILCQRVPAPPGDVQFNIIQDTSNPLYKTARQRLTAHSTSPACAGCHKITDPIGLSLENFDSSGAWRVTENGAPIDTNAELNGVKFSGAAGLAKVIRNEPALTGCLTRRVYAFGVGAQPPRNDEWKAIEKKFADSKYNFPSLMRQVALSSMFFALPAPQVSAK